MVLIKSADKPPFHLVWLLQSYWTWPNTACNMGKTVNNHCQSVELLLAFSQGHELLQRSFIKPPRLWPATAKWATGHQIRVNIVSPATGKRRQIRLEIPLPQRLLRGAVQLWAEEFRDSCGQHKLTLPSATLQIFVRGISWSLGGPSNATVFYLLFSLNRSV